MHSHVTFYAEDPYGLQKIILNGKPSISEPVVTGCAEFLDVSVTAEQGDYLSVNLFNVIAYSRHDRANVSLQE